MFMSMTMIPLDALLSQLAWLAADFERGQASGHGFAAILASLRLKYATATKLDPSTLISEAAARLVEIGRSIAGHIIPTDARAFFDELAPARQESVRVAMASRGVAEPQDAIDDGRFLQYASPRSINQFVLAHPERFFDGCYWDDRLDALDYGSAAATEEARSRVLGYFGGLLADVVWLAQQTSDDLESMSRERLMRASLATSLLSPTGNIGDTD
jgi:hypothetical protein